MGVSEMEGRVEIPWRNQDIKISSSIYTTFKFVQRLSRLELLRAILLKLFLRFLCKIGACGLKFLQADYRHSYLLVCKIPLREFHSENMSRIDMSNDR